jgi:sialic acid synthase SpsE
MKQLRDLFTKSIVARIDLSAGTVLRQEDLSIKKPGTGIPASELQRVVGRTLIRSVQADEVLRESDLV